jgi:hypothetical protein
MGNEAIKERIGKDLLTYSEAAEHLAKERIQGQDWSGIPMPVVGLDLILEPRYRHQGMAEFRWKECYDEEGNRHEFPQEPAPAASDYTKTNSWWSERLKLTIYILTNKEGRAHCRIKPMEKLSFTLMTLEAAAAWPVDAERKAQQKLSSLIPQDQFEMYQLTGHFAEVSQRSQVTYLFRRGRPTIAMREHGEHLLALCALCLHPIGYYADTWAGVMCPTDEVIAHLLMMRGCEAKFWANANQHPLEHPAAGL